LKEKELRKMMGFNGKIEKKQEHLKEKDYRYYPKFNTAATPFCPSLYLEKEG
jgi:hypothetical protein